MFFLGIFLLQNNGLARLVLFQCFYTCKYIFWASWIGPCFGLTYFNLGFQAKPLHWIRPFFGAKWPISTNFGNNWVRNTVSEIIREVPLFVVLELTKLEYPLFFIHMAPDHQHLEFKKLIGTRAHEARVPSVTIT